MTAPAAYVAAGAVFSYAKYSYLTAKCSNCVATTRFSSALCRKARKAMLLKLISATDLKLMKAKYYLQRMKETKNNPNYLDFECELESFLMHARSVTGLPHPRFKVTKSGSLKGQYNNKWFLEIEVSNRDAGKGPGFENWYNQKVLELKGDAIMHFLHNERDAVVHLKNNKTSYIHQQILNVTFIEHLSISDSIKMASVSVSDEANAEELDIKLPSIPLVPDKATETTIQHVEHMWFFDTEEISGNKEVIFVCEHFVNVLEAILEDCKKQGYL